MKALHIKTGKIYTQHEENTAWYDKILFYRDEMRIMIRRLQEIAAKNTSGTVLAQVEHFQNQFLIHSGHMDDILKEIRKSNQLVEKEIMANETAVDHRSMEDHAALRNNMELFEGSFALLRKEFNSFLSKWM